MAASCPNLVRHLRCAFGGLPRVLRIALCHRLYSGNRLADVFDSTRLILAAGCDLANHSIALENGLRYAAEIGMRNSTELDTVPDIGNSPLDDIRAASCGFCSALGQRTYLVRATNYLTTHSEAIQPKLL
jgi:hypothetical protein